MAHDRQLEREEMIPLPKQLQERRSESLSPTDKQKESLAVLADWWAVYGQIYRDDPTELLAVAFRETLQDLPAIILHAACLKAQKECPQFRPTPGRVYEIAEAMLLAQQKGNRPEYLDEPPLSEAERLAELMSPEYLEARSKIVGIR